MAQKRRESILEAAAAVFSEKGFHAATVEEIAARAGIGKSTVYEYFESKEDLFREVFRQGMENYLAAMRGRLKQPCTVRDVLTAVAAAHFNFIAENRHLARIFSDEVRLPLPQTREWLRQLRERKLAMVAGLIEQGAAEGEFRQVDARLAAEVFLGALGALCLPLLCGPDEVGAEDDGGDDPDRLQERLIRGLEILFEGLLKSRGVPV